MYWWFEQSRKELEKSKNNFINIIFKILTELEVIEEDMMKGEGKNLKSAAEDNMLSIMQVVSLCGSNLIEVLFFHFQLRCY